MLKFTNSDPGLLDRIAENGEAGKLSRVRAEGSRLIARDGGNGAAVSRDYPSLHMATRNEA